jgi:Rrf2 family protein
MNFKETRMLSQTTEYALRAVVYLAEHNDSAHTTQQIAAATKVPMGYLSKVLQNLVKMSLISSQRGLGGGFVLAKTPEELTIYEIVQAVDPLQRIHVCPLNLAGHGAELCPLHRRLDSTVAMVEKSFRSSTLAEMLAEPSGTKPLCPFPYRDKNKETKPKKSKPKKKSAAE